MSNLIIANSQCKQAMKDAIRRLRRIRITCGEQDDDDEDLRHRDPLLACIQRFEARVNETQDLLSGDFSSPGAMSDTDRLSIRRGVAAATTELRELETMYEKADMAYNTAALKNKNPEKIEELEEQRLRAKKAFDEAHGLFTELRKLHDERRADEAAVQERARAKGKDLGRPMSREPVASVDGGRSERKTLRRAMDILARSHGIIDDQRTNADDANFDSEMYEPGAEMALATDGGTRAQFGKVREQKKVVAASLARIDQGVARLHEMSKMMAAEIDTQTQRVERIGRIIDDRQQSLYDVTKRVDEINKEIKPMNQCFNVMCFLVLLSVIGFILYYYDVW